MGLILPTSDDQDQNTHISYGFSKWRNADLILVFCTYFDRIRQK